MFPVFHYTAVTTVFLFQALQNADNVFLKLEE